MKKCEKCRDELSAEYFLNCASQFFLGGGIEFDEFIDSANMVHEKYAVMADDNGWHKIAEMIRDLIKEDTK